MIQDKQLCKLQRLAKINFADDELQRFTHKLNNAITMIDQLHEIDQNILDTQIDDSIAAQTQRLREDIVTEHDKSQELFSNVPDAGKTFAQEVKCFVVPKIIE